MTDVPNPTPAAAPTSQQSVTLAADDTLAVINTLGQLAAAIVPGEAQLVALVTGAAGLIRNTLLPAIQHLSAQTLSIAEQVALKAEADAERVRLGLPPAANN